MCQAARSSTITACSRGPSFLAALPRNFCIVAVFASRYGASIDHPVAGSTMPKIQIDFRPFCRTTVGRDPLVAHTAVNVPCCPKRASSWNQMRTFVRGREARTLFTKKGRAA